MKTLSKFLFVLLLFAFPKANASTSDDDVRKEKTISKSYSVNADATLDVSNRYGSVYITTGDENVISVKVVIRVSGRSADAVDKRLNSIDIDLEGTRSMVTARTKMAGNSGKTNLEINYTIVIPRKGDIKVNNQYGPVILDRIGGDSVINLQYGKLTAAALDGNAKLNLQYADNSTIGSMKSGAINVQYSGLKIDKSGTVTCNSEYTTIHLGDCTAMTLNMNYGGLIAKSMGDLNMNGNYFELNVGNQEKDLTVRGDYNNIKIQNVLASAGNITISGSYDNVSIFHDPGYAFNFDIKLDYVDFNSNSGLQYKSRREARTGAAYTGFYKSSGPAGVAIDLDYGTLKINKK